MNTSIHSIALRSRFSRLVLATATVVATCVGVLVLSHSGASSGASHGRYAVVHTNEVESAPTDEIYTIPGQGANDGQVYESTIGSSATTTLTSGYAARFIPNYQGDSYLAIYHSSTGPSVFDSTTTSGDAALGISGGNNNQLNSALLSDAGDVYSYDNGVVTEQVAATGSIIRQYSVPTLAPDPDAGSLPSYATIQAPTAVAGLVSGLVIDGGDLYALQYTDFAASVDNLTTGVSKELTGFGTLRGGVLGSDGNIYVVAWAPNIQSATVKVLEIDPSSLAVMSTMDTGLYPAGTANAQTIANTSNGAYIYISQGGGQGSTQYSYLFGASSAGLDNYLALPANVGMFMQQFGGGLYLYGGEAKNLVSVFSLSTEELTQGVASLSTPAGSYVLAIG